MGYTHFDGLDPTNFKINGTEVTATASELNALDGITATVSELNKLDGTSADADDFGILPNMIASITWNIGSESDGTITVGAQAVDAGGDDLSGVYAMLMYLADDAAGGTITTSTPGTVADGSAGDIEEFTAEKAWLGVTNNAGSLDFDVVQSGAGTWYPVAQLPTGQIDVGGAIEYAS